MKKHLFVTIMLATASLSSFATVEPTEADSAYSTRGVRRNWGSGEHLDLYNVKPNFSAISPSGHKLFYHIKNKSKLTVEVVDSCASGKFTELEGDLIIPATVQYGGTTYKVVSIGATAFCYAFPANKFLTSVVISEGVETIEEAAFQYNKKIKSVSLPNSLSTLGPFAFDLCSITDLVIPGENLRVIKGATFDSSDLNSLVIKEGVEKIESFAFVCGYNGCRVELPSTLTQICFAGFYLGHGDELTLVVNKKTPFKIDDYINRNELAYGIDDWGVEGNKIKVYVPAGCADAYKKDEHWSKVTILEMPTDIEESQTITESNFYSANGILYSKEPVIYSVYDMVGRCLFTGNKSELALPKGLYIVKTAGKAEKVMVR